MSARAAIWTIAALATFGVILRPWRLPEATWAIAGAVILVASGLLPPIEALRGIARGTDVYLFLIGMMLLAELARAEGLFDWLAAHAARHARGQATRLFTLIYLVGLLVTVFLSNDATAVVLTPAVAAAARAAQAEPLPYLLICAFIANAASFVLPISNPANLVVYASHMPSLAQWVPRYAWPSLAAIVATYTALRLTQRACLRRKIADTVPVPKLSSAGRAAACGIAAAGLTLMVASARGWNLGLPTFLAGAGACLVVVVLNRRPPWRLLGEISWSIIPLVAGLFVLVAAVARTGVLAMLAQQLGVAADQSLSATAWTIGVGSGLLCNAVNNLPAGLIAGGAVQAAHTPARVTQAALIGIDLGPNLSVTGSLATILWLTALRREGITVSAWRFLRLGALIMPPALLLSLAALSVGP